MAPTIKKSKVNETDSGDASQPLNPSDQQQERHLKLLFKDTLMGEAAKPCSVRIPALIIVMILMKIQTRKMMMNVQ